MMGTWNEQAKELYLAKRGEDKEEAKRIEI